jgi:ornithine decarboxylase
MEQLRAAGMEIEIINLGGGFPCAYAGKERPMSVSEIARHTLAQFMRLPYRPELILEPGRGIVAATAVLVSSVIARVERRGTTWLFLDAGVYNGLFETLACQGSTRYQITCLGQSGGCEQDLYSLAGPTGDSPDVVARGVALPRHIDVGDKLVFHAAGAYSLAVSSRFNGFPKPGVHLVS